MDSLRREEENLYAEGKEAAGTDGQAPGSNTTDHAGIPATSASQTRPLRIFHRSTMSYPLTT